MHEGHEDLIRKLAEALIRKLAEAQDRIFDMLLGDDGQAFQEARKYLTRERPDLAERLTVQNTPAYRG
jgi:hypothetical protein